MLANDELTLLIKSKYPSFLWNRLMRIRGEPTQQTASQLGLIYYSVVYERQAFKRGFKEGLINKQGSRKDASKPSLPD